MKCNALRAFVQKRWYLTWPEDPQDLEWFYERLTLQIFKNTKVELFEVQKPKSAKPEPKIKEAIQLKNIQEVTCWTLKKLSTV